MRTRVFTVAVACVTSVALVAWRAPVAHQAAPTVPASFLDPASRAVTLYRTPPQTPIAVLPDGSTLAALPAADGASAVLWRVGLDGAWTRMATTPAPVYDFVADSPSSVLIATEAGRIARVDLATGAITHVAQINVPEGRDLSRLLVLDDGSVLATDRFGAWRIRDGASEAVLGPSDGEWIRSPVAVPGGGFAFVDLERRAVIRVAADGRRSSILRLPVASTLNTQLTAAGDMIVVVAPDRLVRLDGGRVTAMVAINNARAYGNGDGFGPAAFSVDAQKAMLAADASLLVVSTPGLRALVPPTSPRLRVRFAPSTWHTVKYGHIAYVASTAGTIDLRVPGTAIHVSAVIAGGHGTLALLHRLAAGEYDLTLRLTAKNGAVTGARAHVSLQRVLTVRRARAALAAAFNESEGDGGGVIGQEVGRCTRRAPRQIDCRIIAYASIPGESSRAVCRGWAIARLALDGLRLSDSFDCSTLG